MPIQFITDEQGNKTAVIVPINEYEDLLHRCHLSLALTDDYKEMMDEMLREENSGKAQYVSYQRIKDRFLRQ